MEGTPFTESFEYDATVEGGLIQEDITYDRLVMQLFVCAPWGDYELVVEAKSTNGETDGVPNEMNRFAFQVENAPDEVRAPKSYIRSTKDGVNYRTTGEIISCPTISAGVFRNERVCVCATELLLDEGQSVESRENF